MSQKNDETNTLAVGFAFVAVGLMIFFAFIFALAAFITFVLTILCLASWNKPLKIGKLIFEPEESRAFVKRGLAGAILLPAFLIFVEVFFDIYINGEYLAHIIAGGYIGGSLGLGLLLAEEQENQSTPPAQYTPPAQQLPAPPRQRAEPRRERKEDFRFASWDDEDDQ